MACSSFLSDVDLRRFRTKPCRRNKNRSVCEFGPDRCQYSHNYQWPRRCPFYLSHATSIRYVPKQCPNVVLRESTETKEKTIGTVVSNKCSRGGSCPYAHSLEEILYHPLIYKTILCYNYSIGECTTYYCPFVHGTAETRDVQLIEWRLPFNYDDTNSNIASPLFPNVLSMASLQFPLKLNIDIKKEAQFKDHWNYALNCPTDIKQTVNNKFVSSAKASLLEKYNQNMLVHQHQLDSNMFEQDNRNNHSTKLKKDSTSSPLHNINCKITTENLQNYNQKDYNSVNEQGIQNSEFEEKQRKHFLHNSIAHNNEIRIPEQKGPYCKTNFNEHNDFSKQKLNEVNLKKNCMISDYLEVLKYSHSPCVSNAISNSVCENSKNHSVILSPCITSTKKNNNLQPNSIPVLSIMEIVADKSLKERLLTTLQCNQILTNEQYQTFLRELQYYNNSSHQTQEDIFEHTNFYSEHNNSSTNQCLTNDNKKNNLSVEQDLCSLKHFFPYSFEPTTASLTDLKKNNNIHQNSGSDKQHHELFYYNINQTQNTKIDESMLHCLEKKLFRKAASSLCTN